MAYSKKSLVGHVSGSVTVQRLLEERSPNGKRLWECLCTCGKVQIISTEALCRRAQKTWCVCKKSVGWSDLTGRRFGKLVVVEQTSA
jgi:hypothetical protein